MIAQWSFATASERERPCGDVDEFDVSRHRFRFLRVPPLDRKRPIAGAVARFALGRALQCHIRPSPCHDVADVVVGPGDENAPIQKRFPVAPVAPRRPIDAVFPGGPGSLGGLRALRALAQLATGNDERRDGASRTTEPTPPLSLPSCGDIRSSSWRDDELFDVVGSSRRSGSGSTVAPAAAAAASRDGFVASRSASAASENFAVDRACRRHDRPGRSISDAPCGRARRPRCRRRSRARRRVEPNQIIDVEFGPIRVGIEPVVERDFDVGHRACKQCE